MNAYYHLENKTYAPIEDRHFTDDPSAVIGFFMILMKHEKLIDAVNEHLTYIGPIPVEYKDRLVNEMS